MKPLWAADKYTYRILWSEGDCRYVGVCTEFPDLRVTATTTLGALAGIQRRVGEEIESLHRARKATPTPLAYSVLRGI
jgi:hypothetical protein